MLYYVDFSLMSRRTVNSGETRVQVLPCFLGEMDSTLLLVVIFVSLDMFEMCGYSMVLCTQLMKFVLRKDRSNVSLNRERVPNLCSVVGLGYKTDTVKDPARFKISHHSLCWKHRGCDCEFSLSISVFFLLCFLSTFFLPNFLPKQMSASTSTWCMVSSDVHLPRPVMQYGSKIIRVKWLVVERSPSTAILKTTFCYL